MTLATSRHGQSELSEPSDVSASSPDRQQCILQVLDELTEALASMIQGAREVCY